MGGLSVGVPGTVRGWETALKRYGTRSLRSLLRPGQQIAARASSSTRRSRPGRRQQGDLRRLHVDAGALPRPRATRRSRWRGPAQPGHGQDLRAHRRQPGPLLHRRDRARHRADRAAPAPGAGLRPPAEVHPGTMTSRDLAALRGDPPQADQGRLPRARRLRHGPAVLGRLDRRRGAEHPRGLLAARATTATRRCTATSRPRSSPTPTAARTSATRRTSTCRCAACCRTRLPPSGGR